MLIQGKHAKVKLHQEQIRVFKTYEDYTYVDNEYFALDFLAKQEIMDLHPKKESPFTISMDLITDAESPGLENPEKRQDLIKNLVSYLKILHANSYNEYGLYITHEDLFPDNLLICNNSDTLYFIDWGLSKKRSSIYPDIASAALGIMNDYPEYYKFFLEEYFDNLSSVDIKLIELYIKDLYEQYKEIREKNNIETESLNIRLKKAYEITRKLSV